MKRFLHTFLMAVASVWGSSALAQGTSTFDGVVFRDLDGNGIQDSGEEGIPGVLIELRGGTDDIFDVPLQRAVITGDDGSYSFSKNNLPNASDYRLRFYYPEEAFGISNPTGISRNGAWAQTNAFIINNNNLSETVNLGLEPIYETLVYSTDKPLALTNWPATGLFPLELPQSPTGYGVLKEVRLYFNYHVVNPNITISNQGGEENVEGSVQTQAQFQALTPFDNTPYIRTTQGYSEEIDLGPTESHSFGDLHSAQGGQRHTYSVSFNPDFVGGGTFEVGVKSIGQSGFIGSGNFAGSVSTVSGVGIFIVYIYEEGSLPVKLANFSARTEANIGILNWSTTEETNSFAFEVERSVNGKKWATIGTVAAKGESDRLANYTFPDAGLTKGINYYRLKMIDRDGSFNHSHIISLRSSFGKEVRAVTYPNPTSEAVFIQNVDAGEIKSIDVIGTNGRALLNSKVYDSSKGIDVRDIPNGLYLVRYTLATGEQETLKVIVRH